MKLKSCNFTYKHFGCKENLNYEVCEAAKLRFKKSSQQLQPTIKVPGEESFYVKRANTAAGSIFHLPVKKSFARINVPPPPLPLSGNKFTLIKRNIISEV